MTRATVLVVHPELDQQARIVDLLRPIGYPIETAVDLRTAIATYQQTTIGAVVTPDIRVPFDKPATVEGIQKASVKLPVVVLIRERSQEKCPKATQLLMGLQHYLIWPEEADELPFHVRGLLRTSELLQYGSEDPGAPDWVPSLREAGEAQQRREVLNAMRVTNGNVTRAADLLGLSRGGLQYRLRKYGVAYPAR